MSSLLASVGAASRNIRTDVLIVQSLLKAKGFSPGVPDGICGVKTLSAIRAFQAAFVLHPDCRVAPASTTWNRLTEAKQLTPPSKDVSWSGDSAQWSQEKKLQSLKPEFRIKVQSLLAALARREFKPKIVFGWRSVAVQLQLYNRGSSKVKFSFHNAQRRDGTPNAYAADIIDARYAWSPQAASSGFWDALGAEGKVQGLFWGGDWSGFRDWAHVQFVANSQLGAVKQESGL